MSDQEPEEETFGKDDQAAKHQGLLVLIGLKVLVMMNSLQNIVTSGAQSLLMLMGSKFLIKMTRLQNIIIKEQFFVAWSSLSKISIPSTSGGLEHLK